MSQRASLLFSLGLILAVTATCNTARQSGDDECSPPESCTAQPPGPRPRPGDPGEDTLITLGKGGTPFNPGSEGSSGVKVDDMGKLAIDPGSIAINQRPVIWVANSAEGTVSKVDTRTMTETARYWTGPKGRSNDPSRTTVGLNSDVVVANRSGSSAVRIAGLSECADLRSPSCQCKDKNGDGRITTSTGPNDVKAWGDDECVLWHTDLRPSSYPRGAVFDAQVGLDGQLSTTVYIGTYTTPSILYRIDANTGKILKEIPLGNTMVYGAVIDKRGVVWIRDARGSGTLTFVDVNRGDMVGQTQQPSPCAYGITADPEGRIWTSGSGQGGNCAARYTPDPMDLSKGTWERAILPGASFPRGLAVDAKKTVWVADTSTGVYAVDTETLMVKHTIPMGAGGKNFIGMAIDFDGMVWAINNSDSTAYKINPDDVRDIKTVRVGQNPYTYSDMTGFQLRNAAAPTGRFRYTFQGCGADTKWTRVWIDAEYDGGTAIVVSARTAKDAMALQGEPFTLIGQTPQDPTPLKLDKLGAKQVSALLQLEVQLRTIHPAFSPRLRQLKVGAICNVIK